MALTGRLNKLRSTLLFSGVLLLFYGCAFNDFEDVELTWGEPWKVNSEIRSGLSVTNKPLVDDIIVEGVVVTSDEAGNFYKEIILDDMNSDESGVLRLRFGYYDISSIYPRGEVFAVNLRGMVLWRDNGILTAGFPIKGAHSGGRIPTPSIARKVIHPQGKSCEIQYSQTAISEIIEKGVEESVGSLITLKNCYFTEQFGTYSGLRVIAQEGDENTISLYTSPYAMFSVKPVASGLFDISAIVTENQGKLQLKINDLGDLNESNKKLTYNY